MRSLFFPVILLFLSACSNHDEPALKNGDFLFLIAGSSELSQAIDQVTEHDSMHHYSHQGLLQIKGKDTLVWHSAPGKGVVCESMSEFRMDENGSEREMHVYRLNDSMQKYFPVIWKRAQVLKGKPYNETFMMEDDGFYCSEFVYALYSTYGIFELKPMIFRDKQSGEIPTSWLEYYKKLGVQVPEGKQGCNPNGMSASPFLRRIE